MYTCRVVKVEQRVKWSRNSVYWPDQVHNNVQGDKMYIG